jgi:hypothetical protein
MLLCEACIDAHRPATLLCNACSMRTGCVLAGSNGAVFAQAAQFPGASTAEGKGNAAGGPSEVRLC